MATDIGASLMHKSAGHAWCPLVMIPVEPLAGERLRRQNGDVIRSFSDRLQLCQELLQAGPRRFEWSNRGLDEGGQVGLQRYALRLCLRYHALFYLRLQIEHDRH